MLFVVTDAVTKEAPNCFATCAEFYLAKGSTIESKTMTYHYKVDGVEYATRSVQYVDASTAAVPTIDYLTNGTITDNADESKDVACTTTYPFVAQTTFDANTAHWYSMAVRANDGNHLLAAKDNGKVGTITKELLGCPEGIGDEMQWAFVGNLKDGFKLYNKANNKQIVVKQVTETVNNKRLLTPNLILPIMKALSSNSERITMVLAFMQPKVIALIDSTRIVLLNGVVLMMVQHSAFKNLMTIY